MAPSGGAPIGPHSVKIKGGRWTVFRFVVLSVAYTSVWLAVSSQLGYYRKLHGPQVLLQLNLAYFLPSIPLLVLSAYLDRSLEKRFGVARTILGRLLVGLLGYGFVCASFPFQPSTIYWLLSSTVALGLFGGVAFSASYQLVARFANKNVIALGLGCSASGPLVLALQVALGMGPTPTRAQLTCLYEVIAAVIVAGLWAAVSLLLRHWDAVEASGREGAGAASCEPSAHPASPVREGLAEPLLAALDAASATEQGGSGAVAIPSAFAASASGTAGIAQDSPRSPSPPGSLGSSLAGVQLSPPRPLLRGASVPPMLHYSAVEPFASPFLTDDSEYPAESFHRASDSFRFAVSSSARDLDFSLPAVRHQDGTSASLAGAPPPPAQTATEQQQQQQQRQHKPDARKTGVAAAGRGGATRKVLVAIWAPLLALFLSSTIALTVFPFFTYVPSSGWLGDSLPKVLFFSRIFADILGRFLPRLRPLAAEAPATVLAAALAKLACVPAFFLYLKSGRRWHSDAAAVAFIAGVWVLGGYINTQANLMAPKLVPSRRKGKAAGLMAIAYQTAHFVGLALATLLAALLYGHIGLDEST